MSAYWKFPVPLDTALALAGSSLAVDVLWVETFFTWERSPLDPQLLYLRMNQPPTGPRGSEFRWFTVLSCVSE